MCICLNCKYINNCSVYMLIEFQHKSQNKKILKNLINPFYPYGSIIILNIFSMQEDSKLEWDLYECLSYVEKPISWLDNNFIHFEQHKYA
ncbi:unnamed protein product [Chrysoparadoxa australica]